MTSEREAYRTLGLGPGATADEIHRAYRRLAKANHPDSAGEGSLPRFLAIRAAYEALTAGGPATRRPGARPGGPATPPRQPWQAEPDRARSTPGTGRRASGGARTGPAAGRPASGTRARTGDPTAPGAGPGYSPGGRASRGSRRPPNRATLGSTSYDAAEEEAFDPTWSGATWYGASSGTYWTINPKEYADPRKHGPEYQRRARRGQGSPDDASDEGFEPSEAEPFEAEPEAPADDGAPAGPGARGAGAPDGPHRARSARRPWPPETSERRSRGGPSVSAEAEAATAGGAPEVGEVRRAPRTDTTPGRAPSGGTDSAGGPGPRPVTGIGRGAAPPPSSADLEREILERLTPLTADRGPTTPSGRLWLALAGWPPLGVALATLAGEASGCGRFAATCVEVFGIGTWIAQLALILLLFALPRVAAVSAVGTLFALAVAAPTAVVLSATGGGRQPDASSFLLGVTLGTAYLVGVGVAIVRRLRSRGRTPDTMAP